ncbi:DNA-directed RNA polymerase II subunit GRINL1A [Sergentomyia squamirostris]
MEKQKEMDKESIKLTRPVNKSQEKVIPDLSKMTKPELLELRDRQSLLLRNKSRLQKLPDKGKRLQEMYEKIQKQLSQLDEIEEAARMFSELNIASRGKSALTNLEWTGKCKAETDFLVDSDDEEAPDPLKVLAQSRNVEKKVKVIKESRLITDEDLREIETFKREPQKSELVVTELQSGDKLKKLREKYSKPPQSDESRSTSSLSGTSGTSAGELEPHAVFLCEKEQLSQIKSKFRPYQTTKSDVHNPETEMKRASDKKWDNTAVTPPLLKHPGVKMLSLQESIEIQMKKQEEIKILEQKKAEEKLLERSLKMVSEDRGAKDLSEFFKTYREVPDSDSLSDLSESSESLDLDSEDEVKDPDAVESKGGVVVSFGQ